MRLGDNQVGDGVAVVRQARQFDDSMIGRKYSTVGSETVRTKTPGEWHAVGNGQRVGSSAVPVGRDRLTVGGSGGQQGVDFLGSKQRQVGVNHQQRGVTNALPSVGQLDVQTATAVVHEPSLASRTWRKEQDARDEVAIVQLGDDASEHRFA